MAQNIFKKAFSVSDQNFKTHGNVEMDITGSEILKWNNLQLQ